jgi:hypothetical protein
MSIFTSLLTGGSASHAESSENANAVATDLIVKGGVTGAITNTSGVAPSTGSFAVNAQGTPDMTVAVSAGVAYAQATPTSQNSQTLRVRNTATSNVTIAANATGSTRYDWIYISISASLAANPASDASTTSTLVASRSSSNTTDNGTPPTYGLLLAIVTVANGASSITNGNIADKRVRLGGVGGVNDENGNEVVKISATASAVNEVTITNGATATGPRMAATGDDSNIDVTVAAKGSTGVVKLEENGVNMLGAWQTWSPTYSNLTIGNGTVTAKYIRIGKLVRFKFVFVLGSTSAVATNPTVSLPVTSVAVVGSAALTPLGSGNFYDTSASTQYGAWLAHNSTTTMAFGPWDASVASLRYGGATSTNPMTWATGDEIHLVGEFESA